MKGAPALGARGGRPGEEARVRGRAMSLEEAIVYALGDADEG